MGEGLTEVHGLKGHGHFTRGAVDGGAKREGAGQLRVEGRRHHQHGRPEEVVSVAVGGFCCCCCRFDGHAHCRGDVLVPEGGLGQHLKMGIVAAAAAAANACEHRSRPRRGPHGHDTRRGIGDGPRRAASPGARPVARPSVTSTTPAPPTAPAPAPAPPDPDPRRCHRPGDVR